MTMKNLLMSCIVVGFLCLSIANALSQTPDYQWTFNNNGINDYTLTVASSTQLYAFSLPANDPPINLIIGKRYEVTVINFSIHPFQVIAKAPTSSGDIILLSMGATVGSFESDSEVAWSDTGAGVVTFTLTQNLVNAMNQAGLIPGYRCGVHIDTMRGNFNVITPIVPQTGMAISLELIADGLTAPLFLTNAGDGSGRLFVVDQIGQIRIIKNGSLLPTPFLDVSSKMVTLTPAYDERGLLGLAFHPQYGTNGRFFIFYSAPTLTPSMNCKSILAEYHVSANPDIADASSEQILLQVDKPEFNHNGGQLAFGPDGYLYVSLGDGGGANDEHGTTGNGQDINTLLGKILRIDVSTSGTYAVPPDNPFVGVAGADEIWAYGFRNPWRFSFDQTGRLLCADVGQNLFEELDIVEKGLNYGWRIMEGSHSFNPPFGGDHTGLTLPVAEYDHTVGVAMVGGYVYRGTRFSALVGKYVFGDWSLPDFSGNGRLMYFSETSPSVWELFEFVTNGGPGSGFGTYVNGFGEGENGELYIASKKTVGPTGSTGTVYHIKSPTSSTDDLWIIYN